MTSIPPPSRGCAFSSGDARSRASARSDGSASIKNPVFWSNSSLTRPWSFISPRCTIATSVQTCSTSLRRCLDKKIVCPSWPSCVIRLRTSTVPAGSIPLVGSSRKNNLGLRQQRGGDTQALFHAQRIRLDFVVAALGQSDPLKQFGYTRRIGRPVGRVPEQLQVLHARQVRIKGRRLNDRSHLWRDRRALTLNIVPKYLRASQCWLDQAKQHTNGGRLSGAIWTQEAVHRSNRNVEVKVVNRNNLFVTFG